MSKRDPIAPKAYSLDPYITIRRAMLAGLVSSIGRHSALQLGEDRVVRFGGLVRERQHQLEAKHQSF